MDLTHLCEELSPLEMNELNGGWMFSKTNQDVMKVAKAVDDFLDAFSDGFSDGFGQWVDRGFI